MNKMQDRKHNLAILGLDVLNKYNQEGITDQEFLVYVIKRIKEIKQNSL